jgi:peptide/nickel transport system substrate-binding protein
VTARDEHTAVFRFKRHYSEQFYDATHHMRILPRHLLDSIPRERLAAHPFNRHPVGDGPYRFVSWKAGEAIELSSDTTFFLGRPGLSRLIWRITPDYPTAITQLTSGEGDFMEYLGGPENVARVAAVPALRIFRYTSPAYTYLGFNLRDPQQLSRPNPLFQDRELRRALSRAIDRQTIVTAVMGNYGSVARGPSSAMTVIGKDTTLPQLGFDTVAANATLDRLGWKRGSDGIRSRNGRRLEFQILVPNSSQVRNRMAVILQDQFKRAGVSVTISVVEFNLFTNRTGAGKFETALLSWNDDPTPSSIRQTWTSRAIGDVNFVGYANPEFDRLVNEAWLADPSRALAKWRAAFSIVNQDAPGIWLANPIQAAAIHRRYEDVTIRPDQWAATLWTWRIAPGGMIERDRATAPTR